MKTKDDIKKLQTEIKRLKRKIIRWQRFTDWEDTKQSYSRAMAEANFGKKPMMPKYESDNKFYKGIK